MAGSSAVSSPTVVATIPVLSNVLGDFADRDVVMGIVSKLVAENKDMTRRLARIAARFKKSEKVGKAQLVLFFDALERGEGEPETEEPDADGPDELDEADAKLRAASGRRSYHLALVDGGSCDRPRRRAAPHVVRRLLVATATRRARPERRSRLASRGRR